MIKVIDSATISLNFYKSLRFRLDIDLCIAKKFYFLFRFRQFVHTRTKNFYEGLLNLKTNQYEQTIKKHEKKPPYAKNMSHAFFFGGLICLLGQGLLWGFENIFSLPQSEASTYMIVTMILLATILTGLGVYDKFGQIAKAGGFIPITGFANSLASSAMEGKSEGIILGIATNMFKLAGAVIVVAVMSGFAFGLIRYFLQQLGIISNLEHEVVKQILGGML